MNIAVWSNLGYNMVVFYAALQAVPREVIEASVVDGAGPVRTALQVKTLWCGPRSSWSPSSP